MNCHTDFVEGAKWMWNIIHSPIDNQINKFGMLLKEVEGMYRNNFLNFDPHFHIYVL